ncbi:T-complex protein 11-like protein 1 [Dendronephthya gigantea]|uniref:T-complex protein 11-like protein 1 n=1 Tax=Dendronephthya gigantea TaxID=151771 RepID=UPI001069B8B7|nr:T-complex protein 11-like protein 1 [Dendronephthya gigantea]
MEKDGEKNDSNLQGARSEGSSSFESIVQNMAIAHEMALNSDFKLNEAASDSFEGQVKKIVHQAFWDILQESISQDPPNYEHAIKLLAEVKETLLSLTFEHNHSLRERINSVLDIDLIKQQSVHGNVDIPGYANFIIQTMSRICVPARDEDIRKLSTVEDGLVALFREIFRVLDLMKLDMANYRLSVLRPQIVQQSVEYERQKFKEYLKANPNGLLSTEQWIKKGHDVARRELNASDDPVGIDGDRSGASCGNDGREGTTNVGLVDVCRHCYSGILLGEGNFPFPETLFMDSYRVAETRLSAQCLVKVVSVIAVTLNIVGKHLASDAEYKTTLKESVAVLLKDLRESDLANAFPNICEQVIKETDSFLSKRELASLDEEKTIVLRQQIMNLAEDGNNICQLFKKRMYDFVKNGLLQPNASNTTPATVPATLADIEHELLDIWKKFGHLVSHNYAVFGPFYEEILKNILSS